MRTSHELARLLLEQPDMPCLAWARQDSSTDILLSADFRTSELYIVDGEEVYDRDNYPAHREARCISLQKCVIIE